MSKVWFIADLHIGHAKVANYRTKGWILPSYLGAQVDAHDRALANNWDNTIGVDDVVWVLGDISSGSTGGQRAALSWLKVRPGRKRLIAGNHDGVHPLHRDAHKWADEYSQAFEYVASGARIRIPLAPPGHMSALLSHFPYTGDHTDTDRHAQWRLRDEGMPIIHGHTHSVTPLSWSLGPASMQIHVGVDAHELHPVPMSWVTERIQKAYR
ncbi:metallophosphoesterase [Mycolicibacterium palauense]|uniref:metallophosphoesterase n=1 Tax=Mycolicibacterium palauense TaxID=2034511 RepID=UPI000BFEFC4F|nr:metallophosphoesterase [Mycolicibacterium palauense]